MSTSNLNDRRFRDAHQAMKILTDCEFDARLAGGCVRDRLLGISPKDYDIATNARPEEVLSLFRKAGYRVVPTGLTHGTVTIVARNGPIEITTLRRDVATDGRHAVVDFAQATFEEDAARRDFTINAMYEDGEGQIFDFFCGLKHLEQRQLVFVGQATERIREDYLRILRFFRFWARFEFTPDRGALQAIVQEKEGLRHVSQERITNELTLLFAAPRIRFVIESMWETGIISLILPELEDHTPNLDLVEVLKSIEETWRPIARLAAVCWNSLQHKDHDSIERISARLRLSRCDTSRLGFLFDGWVRCVQVGKETADALEILEDAEKRGGDEALASLFLPFWHAVAQFGSGDSLERLAFVEKIFRSEDYSRLKRMPISGRELMAALHLAAGPAVGEILRQLKRRYQNGEWRTKKEGLRLAKEKLV